MSENSSKKPPEQAIRRFKLPAWAWVLLLPAWVYGVFLLVQYALVAVAQVLQNNGVPLGSVNPVVLVTLVSVLTYGLAVVLVIWIPYQLWRVRTTRKELGIHDWPTWMDVLLVVPAYVGSVILSIVILAIAVQIAPGTIDLEQQQSLPFTGMMLGTAWHYMFAFVVLVILAPIAEELLFRGYLYGKMRAVTPAWISVLVVGVVFGLAHLYAGEGQPLQWAVALNTAALGVILCILRESTGAIWSSVFVHMLKNGIAFYMLFVVL